MDYYVFEHSVIKQAIKSFTNPACMGDVGLISFRYLGSGDDKFTVTGLLTFLTLVPRSFMLGVREYERLYNITIVNTSI